MLVGYAHVSTTNQNQAITNHGQSVDAGLLDGEIFDENLLQHLSPLDWEHINLTGDYVWRQSRKIEKGKYRPLRSFPKAYPTP